MCNLGQCVGTLRGHEDEVLDVSFDLSGHYLLTASADSTARVYNATTHQLISRLVGHEGEISKVIFIEFLTFITQVINYLLIHKNYFTIRSVNSHNYALLLALISKTFQI